nr:reverse transcriptase domain-containing protein [Tanacetum cinerariifolium]
MTGVEKVSAALENHTLILSPTPIVTKAVVTIQREETGLPHPMCREVIQATKSTQKKYVKDPVEIHNIKQRDEETIEDFMKRFKIETRRMKGALECMWIFGFMHGINNPELTKRLNEHVLKTMEEMKITTTAFIRGKSWPLARRRAMCPGSHKTNLRGIHIKGLIFETRMGIAKNRKKEAAAKDKPTAIYLVRSWQRTVKQKVTQSFEQGKEIVFPPLTTSNGTEGPLIIEAEIGRHIIHRIDYIADWVQWRDYMAARTTKTPSDHRRCTHSTKAWMNFMVVKSLSPYNGIIGRPGLKAIHALPSTVHGILKFQTEAGIVTTCSSLLIPSECVSIETNGPSGYITNWVQRRNYMAARTTKLLVTIGDATHSTKAWINFMIVKSLSSYNGIIGRPGLKAIQAVPSTVHGMLKFPTEEGIVTIRSSLLIPAECALVNTSSVTPGEKKAHPTNLTVPLHPNFIDQEVVVGGSLYDKGRTELCALLKRNLDIFAWQPSDMTGVPRSVTEHRLNVREGYPPIRVQRRNYMAARTTKTPSDHRRCYPFYQSMDELHDCEVAVTLQRHHWTTGVKSNSSSAIHCPWDA